jgi:MATE family, multidrug efflux pump
MRTWTPTLINLLVFWVIELALAWVLSHGGSLEARGVFVALAACYSLLAVVSAIVFRQGRWKTKAI